MSSFSGLATGYTFTASDGAGIGFSGTGYSFSGFSLAGYLGMGTAGSYLIYTVFACGFEVTDFSCTAFSEDF